MPSGVTDFGSQSWLLALMGVQPIPTGYWVALLSSEPGYDMDGSVLAELEPADPAYARVSYATGAAYWDDSQTFVTNTQNVAFGTPSLDWGVQTHYGLCTAANGGDLFAWGEFLDPDYIAAGLPVTIPAGGLIVALSSLDNPIAL